MSALPAKTDKDEAAAAYVALRKELPDTTIRVYTDGSRVGSGDTGANRTLYIGQLKFTDGKGCCGSWRKKGDMEPIAARQGMIPVIRVPLLCTGASSTTV